jgi:hypothetical protein
LAVCLWFCCDCEYATVEELPGAEQFKFYLKVMLRVAEVNAEDRPRPTRNTGAWGTQGSSSFTLMEMETPALRSSGSSSGAPLRREIECGEGLRNEIFATNVNRCRGVRLTFFAQHSEQAGEFADGNEGR